MGVEAAESGSNSITGENTNEHEETEKSTGADDEKMVRDNSSKGKIFWNVGMFFAPENHVDIYTIFFSQCKMTNSWKSTHLVVMQKI